MKSRFPHRQLSASYRQLTSRSNTGNVAEWMVNDVMPKDEDRLSCFTLLPPPTQSNSTASANIHGKVAGLRFSRNLNVRLGNPGCRCNCCTSKVPCQEGSPRAQVPSYQAGCRLLLELAEYRSKEFGFAFSKIQKETYSTRPAPECCGRQRLVIAVAASGSGSNKHEYSK